MSTTVKPAIDFSRLPRKRRVPGWVTLGCVLFGMSFCVALAFLLIDHLEDIAFWISVGRYGNNVKPPRLIGFFITLFGEALVKLIVLAPFAALLGAFVGYRAARALDPTTASILAYIGYPCYIGGMIIFARVIVNM
ncbi:MAG: hypothetical protein KGM43_07695 [Planctomycetota bacterium]|nr:hypothetical protein [Planctomycetota bacterium]